MVPGWGHQAGRLIMVDRLYKKTSLYSSKTIFLRKSVNDGLVPVTGGAVAGLLFDVDKFKMITAGAGLAGIGARDAVEETPGGIGGGV